MDNQTNHNPESYKPKHVAPKIKRRNTLTIVLFVLAFIMIGVGIWWVIAKRPTTKNVAKVPVKSCSEDKAVIGSFMQALAENNRSELRNIYENTKSDPNLKADVNCLYIATKSSIYFGDANQSVEYVGLLKQAYSEKNKFDQIIINSGDTLESLALQSDFLKKQADALESNATFGGVTRQGTP